MVSRHPTRDKTHKTSFVLQLHAFWCHWPLKELIIFYDAGIKTLLNQLNSTERVRSQGVTCRFDEHSQGRGKCYKVGGANWQGNPQRCPERNTCLRTKSPRSWIKLHLPTCFKIVVMFCCLTFEKNPGNLDIFSLYDPYNQFTPTKVGGTCCHFGTTRSKVGGALATQALCLPRPW